MTNFIFYENTTLTLACVPSGATVVYSLETAAHLAGLHPGMLRYYCRRGLFGDAQARAGEEWLFDDNTLYELRRFEHYRRNLGVNRRALPLLCELWREVERLQAELRFLRGA